MSIGIDFILRMSTAAFTKGIATANNSVKSLKQSLREGDLGGGIKAMIGGAGVIAAFKAVIGNAHEVRKSLEEMGKPIPDDINRIAKLGDGLADLKNVAMSAGTAVLGFFTNIGEGIGNAINAGRKAMGAQLVDTDLADKVQRDADAVVAARDKAMKKATDAGGRDNVMKLAAEAAAAKAANDRHGETAATKLNRAIQERVRLEGELGQLEAKKASFSTYDDSFKSQDMAINAGQIAAKKVAIEKARGEVLSATDEVDAAEKQKAAGEKAVAEAQKKLRDFKMDRFLAPDVETLAGTYEFGEGSSRAKSKAIHDAQNVLRLQGLAQQAAGRGNYSSAMELQGKADSLRQGLSGFLRSDEADKGKDLASKLDDVVAELKTINKEKLLVTPVR